MRFWKSIFFILVGVLMLITLPKDSQFHIQGLLGMLLCFVGVTGIVVRLMFDKPWKKESEL